MFIFAADLHLSLVTWQKLPELTDESLMTLDELLAAATHYECPLVLGGDIFDSIRVTPLLLQRTLEIIGKRPPVKIYYINGNHDAITPSWSSFWPNTTHLGAQPVTLPGGEVICGVDFCLAQDFPAAVKKVYPGCDYLVVHQTFDILSNNVPYSIPAETLRGFNCILAGDYHMPITQNLGETTFISPGSTNRRSVSEPVGNWILFKDDGVRVETPFLSRRLLELGAQSDPEIYTDKAVKQFERFNMNGYYEKGILVLRGNITRDAQKKWKEMAQDRFYCLFVPEPVETVAIERSDDSPRPVKGSKAYVLEMLRDFPGGEKAKTIISDYLNSPDALLTSAREKLTLV